MPSPTSPLLDVFTRANEDPLSLAGAWLGPVIPGNAALRLVSNQVKGRNTSGCESYWTKPFPANQEAFFTLATKWSTLDLGVALLTNLQSPGAAGLSGYLVAVFTASGTGIDSAEAYRIDAGAFTKLGATVGALTIASGHRFWLQNVAGVLTLYQNTGGAWSVVMTRTDTTYGVGYLGILADDDTPLLDDVGGGAIGTASRMLAVF